MGKERRLYHNKRKKEALSFEESKLSIDNNALLLIKKELEAENAPAIRIFTSGGCCARFEITPVKKALAGDVIYTQGGIKVYIEKELAENTSAIKIKFDEKKGLIIEIINTGKPLIPRI